MKNERPLSSAFTRRDLFRYTGLLGAAAGITATLAACSGGPASTGCRRSGAQGSDHRHRLRQRPELGPDADGLRLRHGAVNHIYEGLLDTDPITREPYAALATALPDRRNATAWKFTLREGAKWHDGKPVTADDVVFTFERILDPRQNVLIGTFFRSWLQEVKKVDDRTVELVFKFPFPDAAPRLPIAKIMPKHVFGPRRLGRGQGRQGGRLRTVQADRAPPEVATPPSRRSPTTTARARPRSRR